MEQRIVLQAFQFLLAMVSGISLGIIYDLLWGLRREVPRITWFADLIMGGSLLFSNLLLLLYVGDGEYRIFFPVGVLWGFLFWRGTVSSLFRMATRAFWKFILYPGRKIWCFLKKILKKVKIFLKTPFQMGKNRLE